MLSKIPGPSKDLRWFVKQHTDRGPHKTFTEHSEEQENFEQNQFGPTVMYPPSYPPKKQSSYWSTLLKHPCFPLLYFLLQSSGREKLFKKEVTGCFLPCSDWHIQIMNLNIIKQINQQWFSNFSIPWESPAEALEMQILRSHFMIGPTFCIFNKHPGDSDTWLNKWKFQDWRVCLQENKNCYFQIQMVIATGYK